MSADDPVPGTPDLLGRVVVVVGAGSSGAGVSNGEAAAVTYARAGAAVACVDRDAVEAERVAALIDAEGGTAMAVVADAADDADVARAVASISDAWEPPDGLHHNVGAVVAGGVTDLDPAAWDSALRLNLTSAYLVTRHVLPAMLERGCGAIVTVSSTAALRHTGYVYPAYSAAKAGLGQLTVSLALTYADRGIRANAVVPGLIDTPLVTRALTDDEDVEDVLAARHAASPTGRMGSPWDVAQAALFLMSDRAAYVNGVLLPVDGGLAARCL